MPKLVIHGGNDEIEGTAITQGEEATLTNVLQALVLEPLTYTDRRGKKWQCAYWNFYDYEADETVAHDAGVISEAAVREGYAIRAGEGPLVGFTPSQDVKLVLYWMPVEGEDDPDEPDDPEVGWICRSTGMTI